MNRTARDIFVSVVASLITSIVVAIVASTGSCIGDKVLNAVRGDLAKELKNDNEFKENVRGQAGPTGPRGPSGPQGPQGPQGPVPSTQGLVSEIKGLDDRIAKLEARPSPPPQQSCRDTLSRAIGSTFAEGAGSGKTYAEWARDIRVVLSACETVARDSTKASKLDASRHFGVLEGIADQFEAHREPNAKVHHGGDNAPYKEADKALPSANALLNAIK